MKTFFIALICVLCAQNAFAQTEEKADADNSTATFTGMVTDPAGGPVNGASVILKNLKTEVETKELSDASGKYVIAGIAPGDYRMSVETFGFNDIVQDRVTLAAGDQKQADFKIQASFMNWAHVHLLLNHFPTIGFGVGLGIFLVGLLGKSEEIKRVGLVVFFLIAVVAIPTYITGSTAERILKYRSDISVAAIRAHEDAALWAFAFMELTGFIAWLGIWQFRLISRVARWNASLVLVLSILTFTVMARAANLGGEIHHPEIQAGQAAQASADAGAEPATGMARTIGAFVLEHTWVWPSCETLHFVGLSLLFTVVLLVDLRMLGMGKRMSFPSLYQLMPLGMLGFSINLVTGMFFFLAAPEQYTKNAVFYWKMAFVVLGGINVLYFMLIDEPWKVGAGDDAPLTTKLVAASAICVWVGVLFFGHMLPFIGNAF